MGAVNPPEARERRRLLAQPSPQVKEAVQAYLAQERWGEALECLEAAPDPALAEKLAQSALAAGDLFFWRRAMAALGRPLAAAELERLAQAADAAGKLAFAAQARALMKA